MTPYNVYAAETQTIPNNEMTAKHTGIIMNCDHIEDLGVLPKRAKSGAFKTKVEKLSMALIIDLMTAQAVAVLFIVEWPFKESKARSPPHFLTDQIKNANAPIGVTADFTAKI